MLASRQPAFAEREEFRPFTTGLLRSYHTRADARRDDGWRFAGVFHICSRFTLPRRWFMRELAPRRAE